MSNQIVKLSKVLITILLLSTVFLGCRKDNLNTNPLIKSEEFEQFFKLSFDADPKLLRIVNDLKQRELKEPFLNKLMAECGMPKWDFAEMKINSSGSLHIQTNSVGKSGSNTPTTTAPDTTIVIPLAFDSSKHVNSFIVANLSDSVKIILIKGKDYYKYGYAGSSNKITAQEIAIRCMSFDHKIFNKDTFSIYDKNLAQVYSSKKDSSKVKIIFRSSSLSNLGVKGNLVDQEVCIYYDVEVSYTNCIAPGNCYGWLGSCDGCPDCTVKVIVPQSSCFSYSSSMFSGDTGGGFTGGTGGTSGGGGYSGGLGWGDVYDPLNTRTRVLIDGFNNSGNALSQAQIDWLFNNRNFASNLLSWINEVQVDESIDKAAYLSNSLIAAKIVIDEEINNMASGPYGAAYIQTVIEPNLPLPSVIPIGIYAAKWGTAYTTNCVMLKLQHPDWNNWKIRYEAARSTIHMGLDIIGLIPVVGTVANLVNATLYTLNGEGINASLSVLAAVPVAGWVSAGAKAAIKGENIMLKATDGFIKFTRDQSSFRKALGLVKGDGLIAHHVIPFSLAEGQLVQKAAEGGFHINEVLNGIAVTSLQQAGSHPQYDAKVIQYVDDIVRKYNGIDNMTPSQAYTELQDLINYIKGQIKANPNISLNQLPF